MPIAAEHVIAVRLRGRGEMVDARDLKSLGSNFPCRFKSGRPHQPVSKLSFQARDYTVKSKTTKPANLDIATVGNKVATVDVTIDPRFLNSFSEHPYSPPDPEFDELIWHDSRC